MEEQFFVDGLSSIAVIGGIVRLDFFAFSTTEKEANGQPKPVPQHRLVMTGPAFLLTAKKMQEAVDAIGKMSHQAPPPAEAVAAPAKPPKAPFP